MASTSEPLEISVVIPTRGRSDLVARAVRSALAQTRVPGEVIVVLDGPDPATRAALDYVADDRLRTIELPEQVGAGEARNVGVTAARGTWIAFLDDDDEWLPGKLERQWRGATRSTHRLPVVSSRVFARRPGRDYVWPARPLDPGEPLADYLFVRRGLFQGESLVQTSTLLAPRQLLRRIPFASEPCVHQEWDWLLRATEAGATLELIWEPLAIWNIDARRERLSRRTDWRESQRWIQGLRARVGPRAYAAFLLTIASAAAARDRSWSGFAALPLDAFERGRPRALDLMVHMGLWLVPEVWRHRIKSAFNVGGARR